MCQPSDDIWPKDENGKVIFDDDKADLIQCWKVGSLIVI